MTEYTNLLVIEETLGLPMNVQNVGLTFELEVVPSCQVLGLLELAIFLPT